MRIENRQQILAFAALAVVGLLLLDRMVVRPMSEGWKERSRKIAELKKSISDGDGILKREGNLRARWTQMKSGTLAAESAENDLLEAFRRWARQSNITVSSIQPQQKLGADDEYMTEECHVTASGPVSAMAQFLYNIESDPMALRIESLDITSRDASGRTLALSLRVSGLILGGPAQ